MKEKKAKAYEGFELILHGLQMTAKMWRYMTLFIFVIWLALTLYAYLRKFGTEFSIVSIQYLLAEICVLFSKACLWLKDKAGPFASFIPDPSAWHFTITLKKQTYQITALQLVNLFRKNFLLEVSRFWFKSFLLLIAAETLGSTILVVYFKKVGARELHQTKYVRGTQLVQAKKLAHLIKEKFGKKA